MKYLNFVEYGIAALAIAGLLILLYATAMEQKREVLKSYEKGYIDACKDFYKGKLKYDLIEHEDGTKTWERINTNKNK